MADGLAFCICCKQTWLCTPLSWGRSGLSPRQWIPVCWSDKGKHLWHVREREGERGRERRELKKKKGLKHRPTPLTPEGSCSFACCALFTVEGGRVDPSRSGRLSPTGLGSDGRPIRPGRPGRPGHPSRGGELPPRVCRHVADPSRCLTVAVSNFLV